MQRIYQPLSVKSRELILNKAMIILTCTKYYKVLKVNEGLNFKQWNYRITDVSNWKIYKRSMWNGRIYELLKSEIRNEKINLWQRANMRIGKMASSAEYRMDKQFQNFQFLKPNFGFSSFLVVQFGQFQKFLSWKVQKFGFRKIPEISIWKISKICN